MGIVSVGAPKHRFHRGFYSRADVYEYLTDNVDVQVALTVHVVERSILSERVPDGQYDGTEWV